MLRVAGMRIHREALVCVLTALLPRHTLPWLPAARADPSSCAAPQGAAGSHLPSEKEELKTQAWCSPQETGLAGSTGLSSATLSGAELCRHPECPSLQSSPIWKQGVRCWVGLLRCVCLHQPFPLQRAAQASWKLQGAGELLEEAEGSSKVDIALPSSPASPGRCHPEVLNTALCSGTAHAGALAELCPWSEAAPIHLPHQEPQGATVPLLPGAPGQQELQ